MTQTQIPQKPEVSEKDLVNDIAEGLAPHGYNVKAHTIRVDHELDEDTLTVKAVRKRNGQQVLKIQGNGADPDDE